MDSLLQYIVNYTTTLDFINSLLSGVHLLLLLYIYCVTVTAV